MGIKARYRHRQHHLIMAISRSRFTRSVGADSDLVTDDIYLRPRFGRSLDSAFKLLVGQTTFCLNRRPYRAVRMPVVKTLPALGELGDKTADV